MTIEKLSEQITEFYDKIASWEQSVIRDSELSTTQMHTIEVIGYRRDLRMKELAERLGITTGTLTVAVDRLETMEMVIRRPHETDRRSYCIVLTDKGLQAFEEHHRFHKDFTKEITGDLNDEEIEKLSALLEKILQKI